MPLDLSPTIRDDWSDLMSNPTDNAVGVAGPMAGSADMTDSLAFTGAGPFTVLLAVIGILSAAGGAFLRHAGRILQRSSGTA